MFDALIVEHQGSESPFGYEVEVAFLQKRTEQMFG